MAKHDREHDRHRSFGGGRDRRSSKNERDERGQHQRDHNYDRSVDQDYGGYDSMSYGERGRDMGSQGYTAGGMGHSGRGQEFGRDQYGANRGGYDQSDRDSGYGYGYGQGYGGGRGFDEQDYGGQRYGGTQDYGSRGGYGSRDMGGAERDRGFSGSSRGMDQRGQGFGYSGGQTGHSYGSGNRGHQGGMGQSDLGGYGGASHRGKGPKGYQRDDSRIKEDVCERLCDSEEIDASDIEVKVNGGEVVLEGAVSERRMKRMAEDMIENISGVKDVNNQLRVKKHSMGETSSGGRTESGTSTTFGSSTTAEGQRGEQKKAS